ncbi:uncharacterized protein LOC122958902 isoform X2 [Acropora millepora]|uniref:uncharacterized protein LOC122958902 isoform X2 n=1 Tax=Acropora millepora TaxID=45264 RepID=UPI001CF2759C|nr:uncharacterized protein LOC122958902 isoform X2 [Acropora millepora]
MALSMTMNLFCCVKETSWRIQNFHMNTTKDSAWMRWTIAITLETVQRVDVVWNVYHEDSLKRCTRKKRGWFRWRYLTARRSMPRMGKL